MIQSAESYRRLAEKMTTCFGCKNREVCSLPCNRQLAEHCSGLLIARAQPQSTRKKAAIIALQKKLPAMLAAYDRSLPLFLYHEPRVISTFTRWNNNESDEQINEVLDFCALFA